MNHQEFLRQLPTECQGLTIEPRHKVALQPYFMKEGVWVVLLTDQPGQADKAWRLTTFPRAPHSCQSASPIVQ